MPYDTRTFLIQTGLKSLGYDFGPAPSKYGIIDGDEGPKTRAAVAAFEASKAASEGKPQTGTVAAIMVELAKGQLLLNVRETSKNQGPEIKKFWSATTYPDGYENREPYCAAFMCWLVREAVGGRTVPFSLPRSPLAYDFEKWATANAAKGVSFTTAPKAGDIFTLATASHVGLVVGVDGSSIITIEANTDGSGSREGDGVYKRTRSISSVRKFIRIAA
jgi:peptidoglycan hydrolase-like protein with peptidoglycan-binding domain